jgi:hypothetical protein
MELTLEGCMLAQSPTRLLQRCIAWGELAQLAAYSVGF